MDVLDVCRVYQESKHEPLRISDDVTLASFHLLAVVKPAWTATFCCLHTLAVDDPDRWVAVAPHHLSDATHQHPIDPLPKARVTPSVEVVLDRRTRRILLRQCTPLATGPQNVQNGIHHLPEVDLPRPANTAWRRQE